ncbi:MAG TPA: phasin family protein [Hyphomicrobiales bacterium]|nr:phasin family protein [Hyphomicrobiales bacterium]
MFSNVDDVQKLGRDQAEYALKSFGAASKGFQAIALELAEQSRAAFESSSAAFEKLVAARTPAAAAAVQTDYAKASYENFLARSRRIGDLFAETVKETLKPYEQAFAGSTTQAAE